jgi:phosphomannomutase/phosphoglucomutase
MESERKLFGTHGVRGIVDTELTPQLCLELGESFGTYVGKGRTIVVGHDPRKSSETLEDALCSGLLNCGCDVRRLGMVATPVLSFAVRQLRADAGVMTTASHVPPEYNGVKLYASDGSTCTHAQENEVEALFRSRKLAVASFREKGKTLQCDDITERYMQAVKEFVNVERIKKAGLHVAADCADGAASFLTPKLLKELGCSEVTTLNCNPDGLFSHRRLEPVAENLAELMALVKKSGASIGVAHDGDADRSGFIDETGSFVHGDRILALIVHHMLRGTSGEVIVTTIETSSVILDAAELVHATVEWCPVGEPEVVERMKKTGSRVGGEENIGLIARNFGWSREGPLAIALVLDILAETRQTLSSLLDRYPKYHTIKLALRYPNKEFHRHKDHALQLIGSNLPKGYDRLVTLDGYKMFFGKSWLCIRASGTEPLLRVFAESGDEAKAKELAERGTELVKKAMSESGAGLPSS